MFLGSAAVGKTSLRHGLMNQPLPDKANSTILAETRPVKYEWAMTSGLSGKHWAEVSEDDELAEEVRIVKNFTSPAEHEPTLESHAILPPRTEVDEHKKKVIQASSKQSQSNPDQEVSSSNHDQEVLLHLWDCGGQLVFLDVLPAFLSSRTMFLLMFDASKGLDAPVRDVVFDNGQQNDQQDALIVTTLSLLHRWMALIHGRFGGDRAVPDFPRMFLVGTHFDQLASGQSIKQKREVADEILTKLFSYIKEKAYANMVIGRVVVDNTTAGMGPQADPGFETLQNEVHRFVHDKLTIETPVSWIHFRKVLQLSTKKRKPVIQLDEVYSIAGQCHVPRDEVPSALLFYHELGVFLFYPNIKGLESVVILEPQWLVDQFGKLFASWKRQDAYINMWNTLTCYGILVEPLYKAVLYSVGEYGLTPAALIEMLEHFLLAAPITTTDLHSESGKGKEYFIPLMLLHHVSQPPSLTTALVSNVSYLFSLASGGSALKEAAPVHLTFLSGYVPPGYYVRLTTSLASKPGVKVLFRPGIYRNQITMDIGDADRLTITEHTETVELQYSRQATISKPFGDSCRQLLQLLRECFIRISQWLPGPTCIPQLAFPCPDCARAAQLHISSQAKFCPFTIQHYVSQPLRCHMGHVFVPSPVQECWLQCEINAVQRSDAKFEEEIHLAKSIPAQVAIDLAERLDINPVSAVIHHHRRIGGDYEELTQVLTDMRLTTQLRAVGSVSELSQTPSAACQESKLNELPVQDTPRVNSTTIVTMTTTSLSSIRREQVSLPSQFDKPPELPHLMNVVAQAKNSWEQVAIQLEISLSDVKSIRNKHMMDAMRCYTEVFEEWHKKGSPPYTWATIINVLRAPAVNEKQLADELKEWVLRRSKWETNFD